MSRPGDDAQATALALLLAVLDGQCQDRAHALLCRDDQPHHALEVAHRLAHMLVDSIDVDDRAEMRTDIAAEALNLAHGRPA